MAKSSTKARPLSPASSPFDTFGIDAKLWSGVDLISTSPIDGSRLASLKKDRAASLKGKITRATESFEKWRFVPAPKRGELIRLFAEELRRDKERLAELVTRECGKILAEGRGEVQEMIDICDFAVGLSRQLYGLTVVSERPSHTMQETWHPLGIVAVISAFNFPVAVWAWNFALAIVCGNSVIWKPSEKTPLSALAADAIFRRALERFRNENRETPDHLSQIVLGGADLGAQLSNDGDIALVSATGSSRMGRALAPKVASRFGRSLLELGGNNAIIVTPSADLALARDAILFGAVGTAGQRCTTTRRAIVARAIYEKLGRQLEKAYAQIASHKIGDPLAPSTLVGPLIDSAAFEAMQKALKQAAREGGRVLFGKRALQASHPKAFYAEPALVRIPKQTEIVRTETFAPILYLLPYDTLEEALRLHNDVPQGLASSIFTTDLREAEYFRRWSDCGIANINIGTSGAEIGGAFGGEKETGGGRESGTDSWRNYMRRQTSTAFVGSEKPALAQGLVFDVD